MTPLYGIETEYGLQVEGKGAEDLVAESRAAVNAYRGRFASPWRYRDEDPRNDMRGFHASRLRYDPEDAKFDNPAAVPLPAEDERADHVLVNGARLYNDHGHPEYSTPECASLADIVAHDKAGERIVLACAQARAAELGAPVTIYKNNTDFHGSSYGTHENYLMGRERPFGEVIVALIPFLVTRIVYTGAGKVGVEPRGKPGTFQLSQRADFFTEEASVDTLHRRPLVNTRDEPHADSRLWRRLHVIAGDANLSEYATALKIGTMSLAARLIDDGFVPPLRINRPVETIKEISRDGSYRWPVRLTNGRIVRATEVQRAYLDEARKRFAGDRGDVDWTLAEWSAVLDALDEDPMQLGDRLDWVAKKALIDDFVADDGGDWDDYRLQAIDMAYCDIDPAVGLYGALVDAGQMRRFVSDDAIEAALDTPPSNTRAAIRGELVCRYAESIGNVAWGTVVLRTENDSWVADLDGYLTPEKVAQGLEAIGRESDLRELIKVFGSR
ncbi:MAG: proteasome accessory factor PafA2 family protein [Capsulimonadaceae bacterium]|nr:proteasome accessory factor PafA2 family protein [Capsulimonadaceae bacterium]